MKDVTDSIIPNSTAIEPQSSIPGPTLVTIKTLLSGLLYYASCANNLCKFMKLLDVVFIK
jgi:hypothetical protein